MGEDKITEEKPVHGSVNTIPDCYSLSERKKNAAPVLQQVLEPDIEKHMSHLAGEPSIQNTAAVSHVGLM